MEAQVVTYMFGAVALAVVAAALLVSVFVTVQQRIAAIVHAR